MLKPQGDKRPVPLFTDRFHHLQWPSCVQKYNIPIKSSWVIQHTPCVKKYSESLIRLAYSGNVGNDFKNSERDPERFLIGQCLSELALVCCNVSTTKSHASGLFYSTIFTEASPENSQSGCCVLHRNLMERRSTATKVTWWGCDKIYRVPDQAISHYEANET